MTEYSLYRKVHSLVQLAMGADWGLRSGAQLLVRSEQFLAFD